MKNRKAIILISLGILLLLFHAAIKFGILSVDENKNLTLLNLEGLFGGILFLLGLMELIFKKYLLFIEKKEKSENKS